MDMIELIKQLKQSVERLEESNKQMGIRLDRAQKHLNSAQKDIEEVETILKGGNQYETGENEHR